MKKQKKKEEEEKEILFSTLLLNAANFFFIVNLWSEDGYHIEIAQFRLNIRGGTTTCDLYQFYFFFYLIKNFRILYTNK